MALAAPPALHEALAGLLAELDAATATGPPPLAVDEVVIGGLPTALTDPAVEAARDLIDRVTSFDLEGPIDRVEILQGSIIVHNE